MLLGIDDEPTTLAAHFDGDEYTEDELDEIRQFAEFVKGKEVSNLLDSLPNILEWEVLYI